MYGVGLPDGLHKLRISGCTVHSVQLLFPKMDYSQSLCGPKADLTRSEAEARLFASSLPVILAASVSFCSIQPLLNYSTPSTIGDLLIIQIDRSPHCLD